MMVIICPFRMNGSGKGVDGLVVRTEMGTPQPKRKSRCVQAIATNAAPP
jgi:hypothetical protein